MGRNLIDQSLLFGEVKGKIDDGLAHGGATGASVWVPACGTTAATPVRRRTTAALCEARGAAGGPRRRAARPAQTGARGPPRPAAAALSAFEQCHREECAAGHRRAQDSPGDCPADALRWRAKAVQDECCDEAGEDCADGHPLTCNSDCAAVFLPFFEACESTFDAETAASFATTVTLCQAALGASLATQLGVTCSDGTPTDECVPRCSEATHGWLLLLNVDGEDMKMSCELHHDQHSWIGSASDGGYLGSDAQLFFSAVLSGARPVFTSARFKKTRISAPTSSSGWGRLSGSAETRRHAPRLLRGVGRLRRRRLVPVHSMHPRRCVRRWVSRRSAVRLPARHGRHGLQSGGPVCTTGRFEVQERGELSLTRVNIEGSDSSSG
jgi:hypothetical protein